MISLHTVTETTVGYIFRDSALLVPEHGGPRPLMLLPFAAITGNRKCCTETSSNITGSAITGIYADSTAQAPAGYVFLPVRQVVVDVAENQTICFDILRIKALTTWVQEHVYCGICATPLVPSQTETALICPHCHKTIYPRITPAVITLVHRGDSILLARHAQRNQDVYTCLAGFVESGESLEQAVAREVKEETNITVTNIRYAGSQSWPYPDQLMAAFHADYLNGDIAVQKDEIQEAHWFPTAKCPATPPRGSVAWNLIYGDLSL